MIGGGVEHIKHPDGSLWSVNYCECGGILYKKNLKTDKIQIVTGGKSDSLKFSYIELPSNPDSFSITCSKCDRKSLIASYSDALTVN